MNIYLKKDNTNSNQLVIENLSDLLKISPDTLKKAQYSDFSGKYFEQINNEVIKREKKPKIQKNNFNEQDNIINNKKNNFEENIEKDNISNNSDDENKEPKINDISGIEFKKEDLNIINNNESFIPQYKNLDTSISQKNKIGVMRNFNNSIEGYRNNNNEIKKIIFTIYYNTIFGQEIAISGSNDRLGNWDKNNLLILNWTKGNKWIGEMDINGHDLEDFEFKFVLCQNKEIIAWEPGENNNVYFTALINEIKEYPKGRYNKYQYEYNKNNGELTLNCKWFN